MAEIKKNIDQLFLESFTLFQKNLLQFLKITAVVFLPLVVLLTAIARYGWFPDPGVVFFAVIKGTPNSIAWALLEIATFFLIFALIYFYYIALLITIDAAERKEPISLRAAYKKTFFLGGSFLSIAGLIGWRVSLWSFLLVIPGLYWSILYSFASLALVVDGKKGKEALVFSKQLIKPNFRRYLGYAFLIFIFAAGLFYLVDLWFANIIFGVNEEGEFRLLPTIGQTIFGIFVLHLVIFVTVFFYKFYQDLKLNLTMRDNQ